MSKSNQPDCTECGGTEYTLDHGLYYCNQCHTQSQETQDFHMDDFEVMGAKVHKKHKIRQKKTEMKATNLVYLRKVTVEKCTIMQALLKEQIDWLESEGKVRKGKFRETCREIWYRLLTTQNINEQDSTKWNHKDMEPKLLPGILYLAGVYSEDSICLFQLSSWIRNDEIPYFREFYSKRSITPCPSVAFSNSLPNSLCVSLHQLIQLLKVPVPEIVIHPVPIIEAILVHLHLPKCLKKYVLKILEIIHRSDKQMYLSSIRREYEKNNEGRLLILTVCLLKVLYCLDGEEENKMEHSWDTEVEVRYVEGTDECDYIYLWSDWVRLYTLETILRREIRFSSEISLFPHLGKQSRVLEANDSLFRHLLTAELANIEKKHDPLTIDLIDVFWKGLENHRKKSNKIETDTCATHGDIDETFISIVNDLRENFTPRAVKMHAYFKDLEIKDFSILQFKCRNMTSLDWDMIPQSLHFLLEVCSEMMGLMNYQLFEIVSHTMVAVLESSNSVLGNNPV